MLGTRIDKTTQLSYCYGVLLKAHSLSSPLPDSDKDDGLQDQLLDANEREWTKKIAAAEPEQERFRVLIQQLVVDFHEDTLKDHNAISEIELVGPRH